MNNHLWGNLYLTTKIYKEKYVMTQISKQKRKKVKTQCEY